MEGVDLHFTRDAIAAIADRAIELKTGARALRAIMEKLMLDILFDLPNRENVATVTINRAVVEGRAKPKIKLSAPSKLPPVTKSGSGHSQDAA
jgi:ATP-dependent Clp protease ATP-binding subunit ClpX